jgi:hypothetical protein
MPHKHLLGTIAKILRAEEHWQILNVAIEEYLTACRDQVQLPTHVDAKGKIVRLSIGPMKPPSLVISITIGECVHNARSALDYLWKRLGCTGNFPMSFEIRIKALARRTSTHLSVGAELHSRAATIASEDR